MRSTLRALVVAAGAVVMIWGVLAFRLADWPIYVVYAILSAVFFRFYVEVLPGLTLPVPGLAVTIGFLYVGGPPIIVLRLAEPLIVLLVRAVLPPPRRHWVRAPVGGAGEVATLFWIKDPTDRFAAAAEWANFSLGLAVRWWVVSLLITGDEPAGHPGAIVLAETAGYAAWGLLASLPIYSFGPLMPQLRAARGPRPVLDDLQVMFTMALTPFVFLILYGYRAHGLAGAAVWSLASLGLHFMLKLLTERRVAVEEQNRRLEALNRELEHRERLSAIGKMSSVISHQMLQQLGVIGIYADLIRHAEPGGDPAAAVTQAKVNAAAIEDALGDVNRVLTDLLVFSRDLRLHLYEHRLGDVLAECVEECRAQATERRVVLRLECPTDATARVDKLKIKQAVVNVLRNGIEASPPATEVVVRGGLAGGALEIAVADRGPGIPETHRAAVFTPFFTTKEHGSGLGLAIARQFAEAHGGSISAEWRDGGGVTFVLRLPREGPPSGEGAAVPDLRETNPPDRSTAGSATSSLPAPQAPRPRTIR
jgi:signal transduction histidine kinase